MADVERTLNDAEETAAETGPSEENNEETTPKEESVESEAWKERAEKAEALLVKYREDLKGLANKARKKEPDLDKRIISTLHKENEKRILKSVVDKNSPRFIEELVDDKQFNEIVGYLPRSLDRSSEDSIHSALKVAVTVWKTMNGKEEKEKKEKKNIETDLSASTTTGGGNKETEAKAEDRRFFRKSPDINSWYPAKK